MTVHLPEDLEQYIRSGVESGRYASEEEALSKAVHLLRRQEAHEEAVTLEGIRRGLEDMRAGRTQPLEEAMADIREELDLPRER